jgi:hypothetical protein
LEARVRALMGAATSETVSADAGEEWGQLNALVESVASRHPERYAVGPNRRLWRDRDSAAAGRTTADGDLPELAVIGSGNLGMVWFPRLPRRPTLGEIEERWPGLVAGLTATEGVGLLLVRAANEDAVVFGPRGAHYLATGAVEGEDPLAGYSSRAAPDLLRLDAMPQCGDLVLISRIDQWGQTHAFEGLVGSHGGLGGAQNRAILVYPHGWTLDDDLLGDVDGRRIPVGARAVHRQLVRWRQRATAGDRP